MSAVVIAGDTSGTITLQAPAVSGNTTLTMPIVTDTLAIQSQAVRQVVSTSTGAVATGTTLIPIDDTIPQSSEGDQYMTLAITPKSSTSTLLVYVEACIATNATAGNGSMTMALFKDSDTDALAAQYYTSPGANYGMVMPMFYTMTSGTTSAITFKVRIGGNNPATLTFNGGNSGRYYGGKSISSIKIMEIGG